MKQLLTKIPAIIAMLISIFSVIWYVQSFFETEYTDLWILSVIMAMFSIPFFFIDAIFDFVRARKKNDSMFNYFLALVLIGSIPMVVIFAGSGRDFFNVIWHVYYLAMFVLEIISIKRIFIAMKANKNKAKETAEAE